MLCFPTRLRAAGEGSLLVCLKAMLSVWFYWPGHAPCSLMEVMHSPASGTGITATWGNGAAPIGTALPWPGCATRCLFSAGNMTLQAILFCFFLCFAPGWFLRPMSPPESIAPEVCSCSEKLICAAGLCGLLALCTSTRKPIFLLAADPRLLIGILFLWPLCLRNGLKSPADWPKPVLLPGAGQTPCGCFLVGTTPSSPCAVPSVEVALKNHSSRFLFSFFVVCFVCWFFFLVSLGCFHLLVFLVKVAEKSTRLHRVPRDGVRGQPCQLEPRARVHEAVCPKSPL